MPASVGRMTPPYNRSFLRYGSGTDAGKSPGIEKGPDEGPCGFAASSARMQSHHDHILESRPRLHHVKHPVMKNRQQQLSEKAHEERCRCRDWLLRFMQNDQPKILTKDELRAAAMRELSVSKL